MKNFKFFVAVSAALFFFTVSLDSCKKCDNEPPQARIINNGPDNINMQIQTSGGNTVNINGIAPDSTSPYVSYAAGAIIFTVKLPSAPDVVKLDTLENCVDYDVIISSTNTVTTTATERK